LRRNEDRGTGVETKRVVVLLSLLLLLLHANV